MKNALHTFLFLATAVLPLSAAAQQDVVRDIEFPVNGQVVFSDTFGDPRSGGRSHQGIDILGPKMTPLVSAVDGRVRYMTVPEASWGYGLVIEDFEGWEYWYLHINNDTPGTDDGMGGLENAFAPGLSRGDRVTRGQFVAYMGDSGNAESTTPHLHFEIHPPSGEPINPYLSLINASRGNAYDPEVERMLGHDIDADKHLLYETVRYCVDDQLITSPETQAVYYCGADGKRYVFPDSKTYFTWYDDFSEVITVSKEELAAVPLGGLVTYRPGTKLVKIQTDPKVYAVALGGVLRHVTSPEIAAGLYGTNWAKEVQDVPDAFFTAYAIGEPITFLP